jgi:hypothetical protein
MKHPMTGDYRSTNAKYFPPTKTHRGEFSKKTKRNRFIPIRHFKNKTNQNKLNMKKILVVTACAFLSIIGNKTFAQTANLNITISDVLSFTVSQPAGLSVNFDSETKYNNGITALATDHISVVSSRGYVIKAKAGTVTGTASLLPGTVKITSAIGATNSGNTSGLLSRVMLYCLHQRVLLQPLLQLPTAHGMVLILPTSSISLTSSVQTVRMQVKQLERM